MDKKTKECVFSIAMILLGGYVLHEGSNIVRLASQPPYRISEFSISPGMMPVILGIGLIVFSVILLVRALRGNAGGAASSLAMHLKTSSVRFGRALGDVDIQSMTASVVIMGLYTFLLLGAVPFWIGAVIFLVALMLFLRASSLPVIVLASGVSVALIVILFQVLFKTSLP